MKVFLIFVSLVSYSSWALDTDFSGNLEGQWRHTKNNELAKEDLYQEWDESDFYLFYGNLTGKVEMGNSRVEANWFSRYSKSDLYDPKPNSLGQTEPYLATRIFTFPQKLVARDIFQMQSVKQSGDHQSESVLNKLYYEIEIDENRFMIGRMYVNYGLGEIFNPINPFNQPTALTSITQVAQGNDGMSFTYFANDKHTVQFLLLGDKAIEGYDGQIDKTIWAHGEYQVNDKLQLDYVIGEDQKRDKIGGQISYQFEEVMVFSQIFYQSEYVTDDEPSHNLWDFLLGADRQMDSKWHVRFEGGYQKQNRYVTPQQFERFLPSEYFAALVNIYEIHPLVKLNGTIITDVKTGFTYLIAKATHDLGKNFEVEAFAFVSAAKGDSTEYQAQKLVTTDFGLSLRTFF